METLKRFSDFAKDHRPLEGAKCNITEVLNREIMVMGFKVVSSKYKQGTRCMTLQFRMNDETRILFTGSTVLIKQAETYKDQMPFLATIKKIDRYFTFM